MIDFVRHRVLFFVISAVLIVPGLVSLALPDGINPGIDFTSGSILTLQFEHPVEQGDLREALGSIGHPEAIVQRSDNVYLVRTFPLAGEVRDFAGEIVRPSERQTIEQALEARFGTVDVLGFDSVSPLVAAEIVQKSVLGVIVACGGILLYLWWAFRKVKDSWRYGACAVFALVHDALLLLGIFSLLGRFSHVELDALFITASLTVIGFSVHDTIVVFDRIRENIKLMRREKLADIVNRSINQTLSRTILTAGLTFLTVLALFLFGGEVLRGFSLALVIGILIGTYSSIAIAAPILVAYQEWRVEKGKRPLAMPGKTR
jgi:preprotein translocase subunit SecF